MALPNLKIKTVKMPNGDVYYLVPEMLGKDGFSAELPTLTHNVTIATLDDIPAQLIVKHLDTSTGITQAPDSNESLTGNGTIVLHKISKTGSYTDLLDKPHIPNDQIQSDWNQTNSSSVDFIKNKPTIPTVNNATLTIQVNGNTKGSFTANSSTDLSINITPSDLGLDAAIKFIGVTTTEISDGSTTNPITIEGVSVTAVKGNVVLYGQREFIWVGSSWEEFGDEGSYALKTITITGTGALSGGGTLESNRTITHNVGNAPSQSLGLYKISTDAYSHVNSVTAVVKSDITALGIPGADTWRDVVDNLTSTRTDASLSANQGRLLANGDARDNTKVAKAGDTMTGLLSIAPTATSGNFDEGIRLHPVADWTTITFCANANSGATGTSANTWSIHNNEGTFGFYRNNSNITNASKGFANDGDRWRIKDLGSDTPVSVWGGSTSTYIEFKNSSGSNIGYFGVNASHQPLFNYSSTDYLLALNNDLRKINNTYYERLGSCYDGGNNHGYVRIKIPHNPAVWGMITLECSLRQGYSESSIGKLLIYGNVYSNAWHGLVAYRYGKLGVQVKGVANGSETYIYVTDMPGWSGLTVNRMILGDSITSGDFTNNVEVAYVDALPESGVQDATMYTSATTTDLSNALSGYLPLSGGAMAGTITGAQSGKGIVFQSTDTNGGSWSEGVYVLDTSHNGYSTLTLGNADKTDVLSFVHNGNTHVYYVDIMVNGSYKGGIHFPQKSGTFALTNDIPSMTQSNLISWLGLGSGDSSTPGWGTLTSANGYTGVLRADQPNGGGIALAEKGGQTSLQVDGEIYVQEGQYRLAHMGEAQPASDVYAWAKASSKPSYNFNEIGNRGEAFLEWGGTSHVGGFAPIDAALVSQLSANRVAGISGDAITIERSSDGGSTWIEVDRNTFANYSRKALFTTSSYIPLRSGSQCTTSDRLRITMNASDYGVYTAANKIMMYVSTSGSSGCTVYIDTEYYAYPGEWHEVGTFNLAGWSGWNVLNFSLPGSGCLGGSNSNEHNKRIRFTFACTGVDSTYTGGLEIYKCYIFGGVGWSTPSTLAANGVPYTYDEDGNVNIPAQLTTGNTITTSGNVVPSSQMSGDLGYSWREWNDGYIRQIYTRHLDASAQYSSDKYLYIGYNGTTATRFFTYDGTTRAEHAVIGSNGLTTYNPIYWGDSQHRISQEDGTTLTRYTGSTINLPNSSGKGIAILTDEGGDYGLLYVGSDGATIANSGDTGYVLNVNDKDTGTNILRVAQTSGTSEFNGNLNLNGYTHAAAGLKVTQTSSGSSGTGLYIYDTGNTNWMRTIQVLTPNLSTGNHSCIALGVADSQYNQGQVAFYYAGDGSTSNKLTFGLHSNDDILTISAGGQTTVTGPLNVHSTGNNRANINMISTANVPNDLYFGSNDSQHWSITSRASDEDYRIFLYSTKSGVGVTVDTNYNTGVTDFKYRPTYSGTQLALTSEIPSVPSWALQPNKPSYNFSEIQPGTAVVDYSGGIVFRNETTAWYSGIYYSTPNEEAVIFANKSQGNQDASYQQQWLFAYTDMQNRTPWTDLGSSVAMQIKGHRVAINKMVGNNTQIPYNLDVNGTANATTITVNTKATMQYNSSEDILEFVFA